MTLLPEQNVLLIQHQQTRTVVVTFLLVTATNMIVVVIIHIDLTIEIVTTTIPLY